MIGKICAEGKIKIMKNSLKEWHKKLCKFLMYNYLHPRKHIVKEFHSFRCHDHQCGGGLGDLDIDGRRNLDKCYNCH
jgi:hypothetical protein